MFLPLVSYFSIMVTFHQYRNIKSTANGLDCILLDFLFLLLCLFDLVSFYFVLFYFILFLSLAAQLSFLKRYLGVKPRVWWVWHVDPGLGPPFLQVLTSTGFAVFIIL